MYILENEEYLEKIISHVNPNKGIYLAIDGDW
jgi:5'-3' exonuclease